MTRVPYLSARLQGFGTTVFAEMSALRPVESMNLTAVQSITRLRAPSLSMP